MITSENNFTKILEKTNIIDNIINDLHQKRIYLKHTYEELVNDNTTIDVIATDSFAFQNNIFELKIKNNINIYQKISNHLYGDYYKLLRHITNYINNYMLLSENKTLDESIINSIKLIDNVEPYRLNKNHDQFNVKTAHKIYNYIIDLLELLNKNYKKCDDYIKTREKSLNSGINIENYIDNIRYNNENLKHNIELFNTFLNKYQVYHIKYLSFLHSDIKNLYDNIVIEIDFNNNNFNKKYYVNNIDIDSNIDISNNKIIKKKFSILYKYNNCFNTTIIYTKILLKIFVKINLFMSTIFVIYLFV